MIGTLMSNLGLELALQELHIPFVWAKISGRHAMAGLLARNWMLGGENSGHIVYRQNATTGGAIIAMLQVPMALKHRDQTLAEARQGTRRCPQVLINVRFKGENNPLEHPSVKEASVHVTEQMGGCGRVLLCKPGMEPLVRVIIEGDEEASVRAHAEQLARTVFEVCT